MRDAPWPMPGLENMCLLSFQVLELDRMKNGQRHQFSDVGYLCILIIWPPMEGDTILVLSNQTGVSRLAMEMIFT